MRNETLPAPTVPITEDERGFHEYGEPLRCTYGNVAAVRESSAASGPHVWIFVERSPQMKPGGTPCLHLNEKQARALVARLQTWLDEIPERWGRETP